MNLVVEVSTTSRENGMRIRAVSFDVTGTLLVFREPVAQAYAMCAAKARVCDLPSYEELKPAFKDAWREVCEASPCFGYAEQHGGRFWWKRVVRLTLERAGKEVSDAEFERMFRKVYQYYGTPEAYDVFPEVRGCLETLNGRGLTLGVTSNTPTRTTDSTMPLLDLAKYFDWFVSSADVGREKPAKEIFDVALEDARFWLGDPSLQPQNMLHVGDNFVADYVGARNAGFQALYLDRPGGTINYQDWLVGPDDANLSNVQQDTIQSLDGVLQRIEHNHNTFSA